MRHYRSAVLRDFFGIYIVLPYDLSANRATKHVRVRGVHRPHIALIRRLYFKRVTVCYRVALIFQGVELQRYHRSNRLLYAFFRALVKQAAALCLYAHKIQASYRIDNVVIARQVLQSFGYTFAVLDKFVFGYIFCRVCDRCARLVVGARRVSAIVLIRHFYTLLLIKFPAVIGRVLFRLFRVVREFRNVICGNLYA